MTTPRGLRVTHVSTVHAWTDNRVHYRECASLAELGYEVSLVAVESDAHATRDAVRVYEIPRMPRLRRVLLGGVRAITVALKSKPSLIHLHDPELIWSIPFLRLLGKKVIYDAHEDIPTQILSKSYLTPVSRPIARLLAYAAVAGARWSNHVIAATEKVASRFPSDKVSVVRNYPTLRDGDASAASVSTRPTRIIYIGGIAPTRGSDVMVSAAEYLPNGWVLDLAGPAPLTLIERLSRLPGWARTTYHGALAPDAARDLLLEARIGLVVLQPTDAYLDSLPTKMFEYFAAGIPVIASDFPLWRRILEEYECGLVVDESSPHAVSEAVQKYAQDHDLLALHSRNARRAVETELNWHYESKTLASVYQSLLRP